MKLSFLFSAVIVFLLSCQQPKNNAQPSTTALEADSIALPEPVKQLTVIDFIGKWKITMETTETTCEGNKEGDITQEIWTVTKRDGKIQVAVTENTTTNSSYEGNFINQKFRLKGSASSFLYKGDVTVKGVLTDEKRFEAEREIIIDQPCKIEYKITGEKKD